MKNFVKELIPYLIILVLVILIRSFIITPITVVGNSMDPTLKDKELLLLSKISYRIGDIKRNDIIVIDEKYRDNDENIKKESIIKRVIGLPGENVYSNDDKIYVDGKEISQYYEHGVTNDFTLKDICIKNVNVECVNNKIPDGYYLVLGDNRSISKDSRSIGLISEEDIKGRAIVRFWPLKKIGIID